MANERNEDEWEILGQEASRFDDRNPDDWEVLGPVSESGGELSDFDSFMDEWDQDPEEAASDLEVIGEGEAGEVVVNVPQPEPKPVPGPRPKSFINESIVRQAGDVISGLEARDVAPPGGFRGGREGGDVAADVEGIQRVGEGFLTGTAQVLDLVGAAVSPRGQADVERRLWERENPITLSQLVTDTVPDWPGRQTLAESAEQGIDSFYDFTGLSPRGGGEDRDAGDVTLNLLGENLGFSGPIGFAVKKLSKWSNEANSWGYKQFAAGKKSPGGQLLTTQINHLQTGAEAFKRFLVSEGAFSTSGALGGGTYWAQGSTAEQREQLADYGNMIASLGSNLIKWTPVGSPLRAMRKMKEEANPTQIKEMWKKHDAQILQSLSRLVPEDDLPALRNKIKEIRVIQQYIPDFNPSVGNVIGTKDSRQIQAIIDTDNFQMASAQYRTNQKAVGKFVDMFADSNDPRARELINVAMKVMSREAKFEADRLAMHVSDIQREIVNNTGKIIDPDLAGKDLKSLLATALEAYEKHIDDIYKAVDPNDSMKFGIDELEATYENILRDGDLGAVVTSEMKGYKFFMDELPKWFENHKSAAAGANELNVTMGLASREGTTISYKELQQMRVALGAQASKFAASDPGSLIPSKLKILKDEIDKILEKNVEGLSDPDLAARHRIATDFYNVQFIPRFGNEDIAKTLTLGGKTMSPDKIMASFWKKADDEVTNIKVLQEIFEENGLNIKDPTLFNAAKDDVFALIEDWALRDLSKALDEGVELKKLPMESFQKWKRLNAEKIRRFPSIQSTLDEIGQDLSAQTDNIAEQLARGEDLTNNVVAKYTGRDAGELVRDMANMSAGKVREEFNEILTNNNMTVKLDPYDLEVNTIDDLIDSIGHPQARKEAQALRDALSQSTVQMLLRRSMGKNAGGFDGKKLLADTEGADRFIKEDALDALLTEDHKLQLSMLRTGTRILGEEISPTRVIELNKVVAALNRYGVSLPSITARVYAAQLGKVGPVFIAFDTGQRVLRGVSEKRGKDIYRKTLYDLKGLEKMIDVRIKAGAGNIDAMKELAEAQKGLMAAMTKAKAFIAEPGKFKKVFIKALENVPYFATQGERIRDFMEETDQIEPSGGLLDFYLRANDTETGQPSRTDARAKFNDIMGVNPDESLLPEIRVPGLTGIAEDIVSTTNKLLAKDEEPEVLSPIVKDGEMVMTEEGRPLYENQFGDWVTERTVGTNLRGKEYNIPTVYDGQFVSTNEAVDRVLEASGDGPLIDPVTNRVLEGFNTVAEAEAAAQARSKEIGDKLKADASGPTIDVGPPLTEEKLTPIVMDGKPVVNSEGKPVFRNEKGEYVIGAPDENLQGTAGDTILESATPNDALREPGSFTGTSGVEAFQGGNDDTLESTPSAEPIQAAPLPEPEGDPTLGQTATPLDERIKSSINPFV